MTMVQMKQIIKVIKKSKRVAVFAHQSADPDCLGSLSAISFLCQQLGKKVDSYVDDEKLPKNYAFMDINVNLSSIFEPSDYDLLISVDVSAPKLLGQYKDAFLCHKNTLVIDHHYERDLIGTYNYVDSNASSCGEIVYDILRISKIEMSKQIATNLYSAIAGDTGCFMHDNTTSNGHKIAGELISLGADFSTANYQLFKLKYKKTFELEKLLNNKIEQIESVSYCIIEQKFLEKEGYSLDDIPYFVNTLLNLEGTKIAYIIKEIGKNNYKVSLRSIKGYDVSKVAQKFGGGGHIQASGITIGCRLKEFQEQLLFECLKETNKVEDNDV